MTLRHGGSLMSRPATMEPMRLLAGVLVLQIVLAGTLIALVATDNVPFVSDEQTRAGGEAQAAGSVPRASSRSFNSRAAYNSVKRQLALGPRPAGSAALQGAGRAAAPRPARRPLPGRARRAAQRDRGRAGQDQAGRGGRRALRHQGPARLRGRQRRRRGHRGHGAAGPHDQAAQAQAHAGVHRLRRRGGARRRVRTPTSTPRACAAARWRPSATRTPPRWCCWTSSASGACG